MAAYVHTLSGGRLDPVTEQFLLWDLPLRRGYQYIHAQLIANGADTVASKNIVGNEVMRDIAYFKKLITQRKQCPS